MIPEYNKILVANDMTPNAAYAFRHAIRIARMSEAKIYVIHVLPEVEPSVLNYVSTVMGEDRLADLELEHKKELQDDIRNRLEEFAKEELKDYPEDLARVEGIEIHHGNPIAMILETADELDVDLVVLGSHGKGRLKYTFLGSVAEKVLRKSHRPVLIVPYR